jgi:hypothetical protein
MELLATLRNEDRHKIDLLYDPEGWRIGSIKKPVYIVRSWKVIDGSEEVRVHDFRLPLQEMLTLIDAVSTKEKLR